MKVLCVHSFAVHGTASMKAILSILGTRVLPVPSLYLSGLSNIEGFIKTTVSFRELFFSSLELARKRKESILLYVGYLGNHTQARIILEGIDQYRDIIQHILVDPVSGDHGRLYVPDEVLEAWPAILDKADWAFPNYTELQWLSGSVIQESYHPEYYIEKFCNRFPNLDLVLTSLPANKDLRVGIRQGEKMKYFSHEKVDANFGGTGDVFLAYFILFVYYEQLDKAIAVEKAALQTLELIKQSVSEGSADLIILPGQH